MARHDDEHSDDDETTVIRDGRESAGAADSAAEQPTAGPGPEGFVGPEEGPGPGIDPGPQRPAIEPPRPAPGGERREIVQPPGPALVAVGLGLLTKNGWIFQDINLTLRPSSVAAIVGPAGHGPHLPAAGAGRPDGGQHGVSHHRWAQRHAGSTQELRAVSRWPGPAGRPYRNRG